jgi:hypothetical protein
MPPKAPKGAEGGRPHDVFDHPEDDLGPRLKGTHDAQAHGHLESRDRDGGEDGEEKHPQDLVLDERLDKARWQQVIEDEADKAGLVRLPRRRDGLFRRLETRVAGRDRQACPALDKVAGEQPEDQRHRRGGEEVAERSHRERARPATGISAAALTASPSASTLDRSFLQPRRLDVAVAEDRYHKNRSGVACTRWNWRNVLAAPPPEGRRRPPALQLPSGSRSER